jgi:transcription factor IIIB subunit 2
MEDDHEIMDAILGEQEIEVKTKIWVEANREYLEQQEERKLAKEREAQDSGASVIKRKRKEKPQEDSQPILPTPASEAASQVPKRTSRKFNYDVFDSLVDNNAVLSVARNIQKAMDTH